MLRWIGWIWLAGLLLAAGAVSAAKPAGAFSDELGTELYDCALALTPQAKSTAASTAVVNLEWVDNANTLRLSITRRAIAIEAVKDGKATRVGSVDVNFPAGAPCHLTILRRNSWLGLLQGDTLLFRGQAPRGRGEQAGITADDGWVVGESTIQRLEPVVFSDDFMRTANEKGLWEIRSGQWNLCSSWDDVPGGAEGAENADYAQNPFSWAGHNADGQALCTVGKPFWEDYTFTAAVNPGENSAAGLAVNMTDANNGLLVRWTPVNDRRSGGNALTLYRLANGNATPLAQSPGGYLPRRWYQISVVSSLEGVRVSIDGTERLAEKNVTPWRGAIGLFTEGGTGAIFDDVTVYGRSVKTDLISEHRLARINAKFQADPKGMGIWAAAKSEWKDFPGVPYYKLHRSEFYGDQWMTLSVTPNAVKTGQLAMILHGDGHDVNAGYRLLIDATPGKTSYTLYRDGVKLAGKDTAELASGTEYALRFWQAGNRLWLEQDGAIVLEATDAHPLPGLRPAYRADGCLAKIGDVLVLGRNVLDYSFTDAPVDWVGEGTWQSTTRWSCAPQWSFLSGWNAGNAALWHKQRFSGDQTFQAFLGLKMEYAREHDMYDDRFRDLAISICTDGHNPRTGYTGIYGAANEDGSVKNTRSVILRNGVLVAEVPLTIPARDAVHQSWFDLELRKHGGLVEFWLNGNLVLSYTDPNPIQGGVPVVWTTDNGISVARARLHYANPPQPRTDPQVALDQPAYPEWANTGATLALAFPNMCSSTPDPVTLQVAVHAAPKNETAVPVVAGTRVSVTPTAIGEHWYEVTATDGKNSSPAFHLSLPVFNPALGRDDSHAVLLYRFDEGKDKIVHDHGTSTPADLSIPGSAGARWIAGQGLSISGAAPLMTTTAVKKLSAIKESKAFTVEFWVSPETVYPANVMATRWYGTLLSCENFSGRRDLAIGHKSYRLLVTPQDLPATEGDPSSLSARGFRVGLQHLVVTWDGATTTAYENGVVIGSKPLPWAPENWATDAVLLLGNDASSQRAFAGAFYLVAIHNRCLTAADVLRHYQAGPSARGGESQLPK